MANGTWKRTTTEERRRARQVKYVHVSKRVGVQKDPATGMSIPVVEIAGRTYEAPAKPDRAQRKETKRFNRWLET